MKYSIVIPVLNNFHYTEAFFKSFEKTVNHIERQNLELLVIDNNSNDETPNFLKNYKSDFKFRVIINKENKGVVKSWNQGVKESQGEKIIICNNDIEFLTPWWITELDKNCQNSVWWTSPKTAYVKDFKKITHNPSHYEQLAYGSDRMSYVVGCCFMIPKIAFDTIGLFDEQFEMKYYEDLDFINRILQAGKRVRMTSSAIVYHAVGATSRKTEGGGQNELKYKEKWGKYPQFDILNKQKNRNTKSIKHFD